MEEPVTADRHAQIVRAAREVFSQEGYTKASIKKIAAEAGLNSTALIYWYFANKAALLKAVLSEASLLIQEINNNPALKDMEPQDAFTVIGEKVIDSFNNPGNKNIFRILISESLINPEVSDYYVETIIQPVMDFLVPYIQCQIDAGIFRPHDPHISTRSFLGTLIQYIFTSYLFPQLRQNQPEAKEYIREVVRIFIKGLGLNPEV